MDAYFRRFEARRPPEPVPHQPARELAFQTLAVTTAVLGTWYLAWRWAASLNRAALWFAVPMALAETLAFVGTVVFFLAIWRTRDTPRQPPARTVNDILERPLEQDRPLIVDVFIATFSEDVELVRLSVRDAKDMTYPHPVVLDIHVLDDGRRPAMAAMAAEEGVGYVTRPDNVGFKAGNLRNALARTQGDLVVICDADTRVFPRFLEELTGYFRDPRVAWVQTPQWFYDLDEGRSLSERLGVVGRLVERVVGEIRIGRDPLGNDPTLFFDVIQRRRNWANASFCCGAGSIHRREAVLDAAVKSFGRAASEEARRAEQAVPGLGASEADGLVREVIAAEAARSTELTPYKFHVSEDIYTSIVLHADAERGWRSVFHPHVLTRMLSPQDLLAWSIQRFKYAGGTLDIFLHDSPFRLRGLSAWQKLMYGASFYSYLAPLWTVVFLLAPLVYLATGLAPVQSYGPAFYLHLLPFLVCNRLAFTLGTWGVSATRGEQYYLAFFWLNLRALWDVVRGRPVKFHVTPKTRSAGKHPGLVWPHLALLAATALGLAFRGALVAGGTGEVSAYVANAFWALHNALSLSPIVVAALRPPAEARS